MGYTYRPAWVSCLGFCPPHLKFLASLWFYPSETRTKKHSDLSAFQFLGPGPMSPWSLWSYWWLIPYNPSSQAQIWLSSTYTYWTEKIYTLKIDIAVNKTIGHSTVIKHRAQSGTSCLHSDTIFLPFLLFLSCLWPFPKSFHNNSSYNPSKKAHHKIEILLSHVQPEAVHPLKL